jgi:hypothetical protein
MQESVGEHEKRDINAQVGRVLRDLGNPQPPLSLSDVRSLLSLDLQYYRSSDPGLVRELEHRFMFLARKIIPDFGKQILGALAKSKLCAFWVPESARILIDADVPKPKHRWIEAHEITHSLVAWHKHYLLGDNATTLDPACHAMLEAEANYGAGRLLFLQERFASESHDLDLSFESIKILAQRYNNSIVSTFWRAIEERDPGRPVFGVISIHPCHPTIGAHDGPQPWRYFIRSQAFRTQFANLSADLAYAAIHHCVTNRKTGPVALATFPFEDANGNAWEFQIECFSNGHALLTLAFPLRRNSVGLPVNVAL